MLESQIQKMLETDRRQQLDNKRQDLELRKLELAEKELEEGPSTKRGLFPSAEVNALQQELNRLKQERELEKQFAERERQVQERERHRPSFMDFARAGRLAQREKDPQVTLKRKPEHKKLTKEKKRKLLQQIIGQAKAEELAKRKRKKSQPKHAPKK